MPVAHPRADAKTIFSPTTTMCVHDSPVLGQGDILEVQAFPTHDSILLVPVTIRDQEKVMAKD